MNLTNKLKKSDMSNSIKAKDQRALLGKVPMMVLPISVVNLLVKVEAGDTKL